MGVSVPELLAKHTSLELRQWMAYESFAGPLSGARMQADIHYLLQWNLYLLGTWVTKEGQKNPIPEPVHTLAEPESEDDEEDD